MAIRLVALDLDGTLLDDEKKISNQAKTSIAEYAKKGVTFTFCTGRVLPEMRGIIAALPKVRYAVLCNGAFLVDLKTGALIRENTLGMEGVREIYGRMKRYDAMFELMLADRVIAQTSCLANPDWYNFRRIEALIAVSREGVPDIGAYLAARQSPVGKVNLFFPTPALRDRARAMASQLPYDIAYPDASNLEFNRLGVNKGTGLRQLADLLGLGAKEVMAIGDSNNDVAMMRYAGTAVAMGNASDEIRRLAGYLTRSNNEDGVAAALHRFLGAGGEDGTS